MANMITILYLALRARPRKSQVPTRAAHDDAVSQAVGVSSPSSSGRAVQPKHGAQPAGRSAPAVHPRRYGVAMRWCCTDEGRLEACWLPTTPGAALHAGGGSEIHNGHTRGPGHEETIQGKQEQGES
jgi:hypothetical protein